MANNKSKSTLAEDVFVFAVGKKDDFKITKVLRPFYFTEGIRIKARKAIYDKFKHMSDSRALAIIINMFDRDGFFDYFSRENCKTYKKYLSERNSEGEIYGNGGSGSETDTADVGIRKDGSGGTLGTGNKVIKYSRNSSSDNSRTTISTAVKELMN